MRLLFVFSVIVLLASCKKEEPVFEPYETPEIPVAINICPDFSLDPATITDNEEYLILKAIYDTYYSQSGWLHIEQKSYSGTPPELIHAFLSRDQLSFDSIAVDNYSLKNQVSYTWGELFNQPVNLISEDELDCFFSNGVEGWGLYYSAYIASNGLLRFARPEITTNNEAIIQYGQYFGLLGCESYIVILEKTAQGWEVKERILIGMC